MCRVIEHYISKLRQTLEGKALSDDQMFTGFDQFVLLTYLELLRVNICHLVISRVSFDLSKFNLVTRFQTIFSTLSEIRLLITQSNCANNWTEYHPIFLLTSSILTTGLELFYPKDSVKQLQQLSELIEFSNKPDQIFQSTNSQTRSFLPLFLLKWNTVDPTHWITTGQPTSDSLIQTVAKLLSQVESKTRLLLRITSNPQSRKSKNHQLQLLQEDLLEINVYEDEMKVLFAIQKHLISVAISNSSDQRTLFTFFEFTNQILESLIELLQYILRFPQIRLENPKDKLYCFLEELLYCLLPFLLMGFSTVVITHYGAGKLAENEEASFRLSKTIDAIAKFITVLDKLNSISQNKRDAFSTLWLKFQEQEPLTRRLSANILSNDKDISKKPYYQLLSLQLPHLFDLEKLASWSLGRVLTSVWIKGIPLSQSEVAAKHLSQLELFAGTIPPELVHSFYSTSRMENHAEQSDIQFLSDVLQLTNSEGPESVLFNYLRKELSPKISSPHFIAEPSIEREMDYLERLITGVLIKHLAMTDLTKQFYTNLGRNQPIPEELQIVWRKVQRLKRWVEQQRQELGSRVSDDSDEQESCSESAFLKSTTQKAQFLLYINKGRFNQMPPLAHRKVSRPIGDVPYLDSNPQEMLGSYFSLWKDLRLENTIQKQEKIVNEIFTFLKDPTLFSEFIAIIQNHIRRAKMREKGLAYLSDLVHSAVPSYPSIQLDIISPWNFLSALRKKDIVEHRAPHNVFDDIEMAFLSDVTALKRSFHSMYNQLALLLTNIPQPGSSKRKCDLGLEQAYVLELFNINFQKEEPFLLDIEIPSKLLRLYSQLKNTTALTKEAQLKILAMFSLRVLIMASNSKEKTEHQQQFEGQIIHDLFNELNSLSKSSFTGDSQENLQDANENCLQVLKLVYSIYCQGATLRPIFKFQWLELILNMVKNAPLLTKLLCFRILTLVLPHQEPSLFDGQGKTILLFFFQVIGLAFEASSSSCSRRMSDLLRVSTTHDVFAVATESVILLRSLLLIAKPLQPSSSISWKSFFMGFSQQRNIYY